MKAGMGFVCVVLAVGCKDDKDAVRADARAADAPPSMAMIGPEGGAIASADGVATLTVPPNAVATATEFAIELVPRAMWPASIEPATPFAVYEITPEGTTFATPATLTWTFASAPPGTNDAMNRPKFIFGYSRSASDVVEPHLETGRTIDPGAVTVTSKIGHLSTQFLSTHIGSSSEALWSEFMTAEMELGGGVERGVDAPWDAPVVQLHALDTFVGLDIRGYRHAVVAPVVDVSPAEWQETAEKLYVETGKSMNNGETYVFTPKARFNCTAAGDGAAFVLIIVNYEPVGGAPRSFNGHVNKTEPVTCIQRAQKPEYTAEVATLTAARISAAAVPSSQMVDLGGSVAMGLYGYNVTLLPGQTIRVCVTTNGSTSTNYYPRYSPGYTFVDGQPGCTDITNLDPNNPNEVLIKLSGTGSDVDVVITTVP